MDQIDLCPLKRLILGAQTSSQLIVVLEQPAAAGGREVLRWLAVTGYGTDEFAWARITCRWHSLGQLVPPEHVKLPSRAPSSA